MALTDYTKCWDAEEHCTCNDKHMGTYKEEYEKLRSICLRIYYARNVGLSPDTIVDCFEEIDEYFREPNVN